MSVKFFGQFLVLEGAISAVELRSAVDLSESENMLIGELATEAKLISEEQALELNRQQLRKDMPFGALAVEEGLITEEQLEGLLRKQAEMRLRLGEACVRLGYLDQTSVYELLRKFHDDQEPYTEDEIDLPGDLSGNPAAAFILNFFPRMTMRVSRIHVKVSPMSGDNLPNQPHKASISLQGEQGLKIMLGAGDDYASKLLTGMHRIMGGDAPSESEVEAEDLQDILGSFLDIVAGNALEVLAADGVKLEVSPTELGAEVEKGISFQIVTTYGSPTLTLAAI